ncbi:MAG: ADP-ribosylglycohydrolase family protein [Bacteroidia bacterium]|nr:ADP-ribosylglycohydrolase family protein [Bacteroidia bacterium]
MMKKELAHDILFGIATGDALGVPVEFLTAEQIAKRPLTTMRGYGTHNQPAGTWSDDSSLAFCQAEGQLEGGSLADIAHHFIWWVNKSWWTPHGTVFDIGNTTFTAIRRLQRLSQEGKNDELAFLGSNEDESSNGNGSLMRILPLLLEFRGEAPFGHFDRIWQVSALTHAHIRAGIACTFYLQFAHYLASGKSIQEAYITCLSDLDVFFEAKDISSYERSIFHDFLPPNLEEIPAERVLSGGYVMESLQAACWGMLRSKDYASAVLPGINLGHDTDTTGAITGGLAGIAYGWKSIDNFWLASLARMEDIQDLAERLEAFYVAN